MSQPRRIPFPPTPRIAPHARRSGDRHRNAPGGTAGPGGSAVSEGSGRRTGQRRRPAPARRPAPSARRSCPGRGVDRPGRRPSAQRPGLSRQPGRGLPGPGPVRRARWAAAARPCGCGPTIPRPCATSAWPCRGWAGTPKRSSTSAAPWSCGRTSPRSTATSASPCANWARLDEALDHFRRAVELDPASAPARTNLGQLLLDRGQAEEALPHCQEAVRLQPDLAALHHNLGNALRTLGRLVEARAAYLEALRLDPDLAVAHAHLGLILQAGGPARRRPALAEAGRRAGAGRRGLLGTPGRAARRAGRAGRGHPLLGARAGPGAGRGGGRIFAWAGRLQEEGRLAEAGEHYRPPPGCNPTRPWPSSTWAGCTRSWASWPRPRPPSAPPCGCSRPMPCPTPAWRRCCAASCPTPTSPRWSSGWPIRSSAPGLRARLLFGLAHVLDAARRLRPRRRLPAPGQRPDAGAGAGPPRLRRRPSTSASSTACCGRSTRGLLRAHGRRWAGDAPARLHLRPAAVGHDADRAGPGQPPADPRRRRAAPGPPVVRGHPRRAGPLRRRRWTASPHLDAAAIAPAGRAAPRRSCGHWTAAGPSGSWTRCRTTTCISACSPRCFPSAVFIHCRRDLRDVAVSCWMTDFRSIRWANDPEHIATASASIAG